MPPPAREGAAVRLLGERLQPQLRRRAGCTGTAQRRDPLISRSQAKPVLARVHPLARAPTVPRPLNPPRPDLPRRRAPLRCCCPGTASRYSSDSGVELTSPARPPACLTERGARRLSTTYGSTSPRSHTPRQRESIVVEPTTDAMQPRRRTPLPASRQAMRRYRLARRVVPRPTWNSSPAQHPFGSP